MKALKTILIAYDGSEAARHAIRESAAILGHGRAVVVYAREPLEGAAAHLGGHPEYKRQSAGGFDLNDRAQRILAEGVTLAREVGFDATGEVVSSTVDAADAIVAAAEEVDASLVIVGSRGRRGLSSVLLGSVSHGVLHKTHRPTLVITAPELGALRAHITDRVASAGGEPARV